jgi:translation initiation factor 2B subunit (eIF-2B alpha/beta/delta family)
VAEEVRTVSAFFVAVRHSTTPVVENAVTWMLSGLNGADTLLADGSFLITPGTYPLAVLCDLRNVPLYMPTEVLKLNRNSYAGNGPKIELDYDADRYAEMRA